MTKKREITSSLVAEPKPQFVRAFLATALGIIVAIGGMARPVRATEVHVNPGMSLSQIQAVVYGGGTVVFDAGNYNFGSGTLNVINSVILQGQTGANIVSTNRYPIRIVNGNVTLDNMTVEGLNFYGVRVYGGGDITFRNCTITGASNGVGVRFSRTYSGDLLVEGCRLKGGERGFSLRNADGARSMTVRNSDIYGYDYGLEAYKVNFPVTVIGNTVTATLRGIWLRYMNQSTVSENIIRGKMLRGIQTTWVSNAVISNNMIDREISPPWHKWWNGAIAIDYGENNIVENNIITGEGRSAIHLWRTRNNLIVNNDCSGYTCRWPGQSWNVCQFWDSDYSSGNTVSGNIWGPVPPESRLAAVVVSMRFEAAPSDDSILDNDYTLCGTPGWTDANPDGPGCVLLTEGTQNNFVSESGNFPPGTGGAKKQVLDVQALPPPDGLGSTTNRVVGHPAKFLAEDVPPGIGQRLKEIMAAIEALPTEEEEEEALLEEQP